MKRVITYGTYDLLHYGHIELLRRAKALGDYLVVVLSSDEFNAGKGKKAYFSYEERKAMLEAIRYVAGVDLGPEARGREEVRHRRLRHGRRLDRKVRRAALGPVQGRLPSPHARDINDPDQERHAGKVGLKES